MLEPADAGVRLTDAIGGAEGVADPVGTAADALGVDTVTLPEVDAVTLPGVDAVTLPGVDAVTLPAFGVALAEIGALAAALGEGATTCAPVLAGVD
jgi:hypothetical protein